MARVSCGDVFMLVCGVLEKCDTKEVMKTVFFGCLGTMKSEIFWWAEHLRGSNEARVVLIAELHIWYIQLSSFKGNAARLSPKQDFAKIENAIFGPSILGDISAHRSDIEKREKDLRCCCYRAPVKTCLVKCKGWIPKVDGKTWFFGTSKKHVFWEYLFNQWVKLKMESTIWKFRVWLTLRTFYFGRAGLLMVLKWGLKSNFGLSEIPLIQTFRKLFFLKKSDFLTMGEKKWNPCFGNIKWTKKHLEV